MVRLPRFTARLVSLRTISSSPRTARIRALTLAFLVCPLVLGQTSGPMQGSSPVEILEKGAPPVAVWISQNKNAEQLGQQITELYLTLYHASPSRLSLQLYSPVEEINAEQVFRKKDLFFGASFPLALDSLACDLNGHLCARSREAASAKDLKSAIRHVSGFKPSTPTWNITANAEMLIPGVRLEKTVRWIAYTKAAGRSLEDIVISELQGCSRFDELCRAGIMNINRKDREIFELSYGAESGAPLTLPVLSAKARIDFSSAPEAAVWEKVLPRPQGVVTLQAVHPTVTAPIPAYWSELYKIKGPIPAASTDPALVIPRATLPDVIKQLDKHLLATSRIRIDAVDDAATTHLVIPDDLKRWQDRFLQGLRFPYSSLTDYPRDARWPAGILIMDHWVDREHCAFIRQPQQDPALRELVVKNVELRNVPSRANCNERTGADKRTDHGTHVTGLIAARTKDGAFWGLNPFAQTYTVQINPEESTTQGQQIATELGNQLSGNPIVVVNLSWGWIRTERRTPDPIGEAIEGAQQILFVASAGNDYQRMDYICDYRAACYDLPNVISVAALADDANGPDRLFSDPDRSQGTNHGRFIHVAAAGQNILSTISGGRFGFFSGTSQAVPQVTALASLLFAKHKGQLSPIQVKNRIIFCSDLLPQLRGQLFGGRINAACTIDQKDNFARILTITGDTPVYGTVQGGGELHFRRDGADYRFPTEQIRGIQAQDATKFTVFYQIGSSAGGRLLKEADLRVANSDQKIILASPISNADTPIAINQIRHFAAPTK
jgi:hypothetical protein